MSYFVVWICISCISFASWKSYNAPVGEISAAIVISGLALLVHWAFVSMRAQGKTGSQP